MDAAFNLEFTRRQYRELMTGQSSQGRLAELDALRGIAASIVVLFHYTWQGVNVLPEVTLIPWGLSWGHYGVELFFAISGFVIFMTLERTRTAADFFVSRFARLFPAYWFAIGLTSLGLVVLGAQSLSQPPEIALVNLSMMQSFLYLPSVDGVYWSLSVELAFYACMLALWRLNLLARIEMVLLGWIALKLLWWGLPELPSRVGAVLAVRYIPWFAIGMTAYRVRTGARSLSEQMPVLLAGLATVAITGPLMDSAVFVAIFAIFAALVAGRLTFLDNRLLLWLGALSYSLYLIHQNLGYAMILALENVGLSPSAALLCAIAASLGVAHAMQTLIEQPTLKAIRNWWKTRKARTVPA
jgi:peptidoglycan/LPS O-acetylase OafA/YrhL